MSQKTAVSQQATGLAMPSSVKLRQKECLQGTLNTAVLVLLRGIIILAAAGLKSKNYKTRESAQWMIQSVAIPVIETVNVLLKSSADPEQIRTPVRIATMGTRMAIRPPRARPQQ